MHKIRQLTLLWRKKQCIHAVVPSTMLAFLGRIVLFLSVKQQQQKQTGFISSRLKKCPLSTLQIHSPTMNHKKMFKVRCLGYNLHFSPALILPVLWGETLLTQMQNQPCVVMEKQFRRLSTPQSLETFIRLNQTNHQPLCCSDELFFSTCTEDKLVKWWRLLFMNLGHIQ